MILAEFALLLIVAVLAGGITKEVQAQVIIAVPTIEVDSINTQFNFIVLLFEENDN